MIKVNIEVNGMVCSGCETRIKNVLQELEHILEIECNHESGLVNIMVDEKIEEHILKDKIEDLGFEVTRISYE